MNPKVTETISQLRSQHPKLWDAYDRPHYVAPKRFEGQYAPWDEIAYRRIAQAASQAKHVEQQAHRAPGTPGVLAAKETSAALSGLQAKVAAPIIYIEQGLGEALLNTEPPKDIPCEEIKWAYRAFHLVLPKGLLKDKANSAILLSVGLLDKGEALACPKSLEDTPVFHRGVFEVPVSSIAIDVYIQDEIETILHAFRPWENRTISEMFQAFTNNLNPDRVTEDESGIIFDALRLALNTVLLLQAKPHYLNTEVTLRKGNPAKAIRELRQARTLGEFLKPRKNGQQSSGILGENGLAFPNQARRGHWKMQPFGPQMAKRKLLWISPYRTKTLEEREKK